MDEPTKHTKTEGESDDVYVYRHAGIQEREGRIPLWLLFVALGLIIWSVYYTIWYWKEG